MVTWTPTTVVPDGVIARLPEPIAVIVGRSPAAGLNLTHDAAYGQIVNMASTKKTGAIRVIPGDADNSYLVHKVEGLSDIVGVRMPYSGPPYLTDGQIMILKRWIALGAPRD